MNNFINLLRGIRNPNQLRNMALQALQKSNPEIANILVQCLNQGQSPKQILKQAIEAGTINQQQFNQFKEMINQYSRFLPFKISMDELNELESVFKGSNNNNGFRF